MAVVILSVGLLVFFGHFLADFFQRTKVPDVLVLMLAGIVLGPVFHLIAPEDFGRVGEVFATLALIIILFEGGIHLNIKHLRSAAGSSITISRATFVVTVLLIAHLADLLLPIGFFTALLIGTILGGTSSAVVVPLIRVLRMGTTASTVLFLESALTDVVVIVLSLALLRWLPAAAAGAAGLGTYTLALDIGKSFVIAGLIGVAGAFVWSAILDRVRQFPNTVFTTFAYVFILYGVAELLGYNGAIAALAFGIAVANFPNIPDRLFGKIFSFRLSEFADHERAFFAEAVFLVKTFFFVFLGVSMKVADWRIAAVGFALALAAFLARAPTIRLLASKATTRRDAALMTALVPKGLASAVLATLPAQVGLAESGSIQGTVYATIFFSILLCAILIFLFERGVLDPITRGWFGKFADQPPPGEYGEAGPPMLIEPALALPEIAPGFQEPNPITELGETTEGDRP